MNNFIKEILYMKKFNFKSLVIGLVIGATLFSGTAYAIEGLNVSPNPFPILIDNVQTAIEAYNINGFTYVKLGDIGKVTNTSVKFNEVDRQIEIQKIADDTPITFQNMEAISRNNNLYISLSDIIANKDTLLSMVGVTILSAPTPTPVPISTPVPTSETQTTATSQPSPTPIPEESSSSANTTDAENLRHEQVLASIQADYNTQINIHSSAQWDYINSKTFNYTENDCITRINDLTQQLDSTTSDIIGVTAYRNLQIQLEEERRKLAEIRYFIPEQTLWNSIHQNKQNKINAENALHQQNLANINNNQ
jgi:hypothetical protein